MPASYYTPIHPILAILPHTGWPCRGRVSRPSYPPINLPAHRHLHSIERQRQLESVISQALGHSLRLGFDFGDREDRAASDVRSRRDREALAAARATLESDPNVREMMERFNATIIPESIEPAGNEANKR